MSQPGANQMHPEDLQVPGITQGSLFPSSFVQLGLSLLMRRLSSRLVLKGTSSSWTTGLSNRRAKRQPSPTV